MDLCVDDVVAGFLCVWGALAELRADLSMNAETNLHGLAAVLVLVEYERECEEELPTHQHDENCIGLPLRLLYIIEIV